MNGKCNKRCMSQFKGHLVVLASLFFILHLTTSYSAASDQPISNIAFGSCSHQNSPQTIWKAIIDYNPQVFIWLGDNIYGDNKRPFRVFGKERTIGPWKNVPRFYPASEQEMESKFNKAKSDPGYSYIREHSKVIGTWDDHDYGLNDAGKELTDKVTNQRLLLDFLDEPSDSSSCRTAGTFFRSYKTNGEEPGSLYNYYMLYFSLLTFPVFVIHKYLFTSFVTFRRKQAGVYTSYTFGPVDKQIKVILLDTRYFRDPISSDGSILGSSQWEWLRKQLNGPPTALTIIGSSVQVISNFSAVTRPFFSVEGWGRFPKERNHLFQIIRDSKRDGILFISGDVHFAEITRYDCATGYPLYDITSSGLTQSVEGVVPPPLQFLLRLIAWLTPTTLRVMQNCRYKSCVYGKPNFGIIEVDWMSDPVTLKIEVRDINGSPVISNKILLSDLEARNIEPSSAIHTAEHQKYCTLEVGLPWIVRYRLAILFIFTLSALLLASFGLACLIIFASRKCFHKCKHD